MRTVLALGLALAACGSVDGADPFALWRVHEHPGGAFHFHYPQPPFERAEGSTPARPVLEAGPADSAAEGAPARFLLEARGAAGEDLDAAGEAESARLVEAGFAVTSAVPRWNRAGDEGLEIRGGTGGVGAVIFLLEGEAGPVVMCVSGTGGIDHPDVELLLDGFEPRAAGGD